MKMDHMDNGLEFVDDEFWGGIDCQIVLSVLPSSTEVVYHNENWLCAKMLGPHSL